MKRTVFTCILMGLGTVCAAEDLPVASDAAFTFNGQEIVISRSSSVDARLPDDRFVGFIPASVNIPAATASPSNPFRNEILMALGPDLLTAGNPADKIFYYRGGTQVWAMLGLSTDKAAQ